MVAGLVQVPWYATVLRQEALAQEICQAARVAHNCAFFLTEEMNGPGRIVESGPTAQVLRHPKDTYTKELLAAMPNPFARAATAAKAAAATQAVAPAAAPAAV